MMTIRKGLLCALAGLLASAMLLSVGAEAEEAPRQYEIELVIFRNLVVDDGGELWPVDYSDWFDEELEDEHSELPTESEILSETEVTWLPSSQFRLTAERNALARSRPYRPLAHLAWRQTVLGRRQARPIELPVVHNDRDGFYVDGFVRVAVERYLHLELDLRLHLPDVTEAGLSPDADYGVPDIRLKEQRRMRSKELHYFDHPRFGVIALITPYETAAESEEAGTPVSAEQQ
jgi:hypothetical protein